jgi:hypothetical protein
MRMPTNLHQSRQHIEHDTIYIANNRSTGQEKYLTGIIPHGAKGTQEKQVKTKKKFARNTAENEDKNPKTLNKFKSPVKHSEASKDITRSRWKQNQERRRIGSTKSTITINRETKARCQK